MLRRILRPLLLWAEPILPSFIRNWLWDDESEEQAPEETLHLKVRDMLGNEPVERVEKWLVGRLQNLQKKSSRAKRGAAKARPSTRVILHPIRVSSEISNAIITSCMMIAQAYEGNGNNAGVLRMIRIASLYRKLSEKQLQKAFDIACRLPSVPGFWVGEAAYDVAYRRKFFRQSASILHNAAAEGDEMSKFVLECFNLSGGD